MNLPRLPVVPLLVLGALATACGEASTSARNQNDERFTAVAAALDINLNQLPNYASPSWPVHYDAITRSRDNTPLDNPVTDRGATLGRVLFYDKKLSINGTVSCASCHQRALGFSDDARLSLGFTGTDRTSAHAMRLANARFFAPGTAFWDRRAPTLEAQVTQPIQNAVEMGFDAAHGGINALLTRMRTLPYYSELFTFTYGDAVISEERLQRALAQYVRSIVSVTSRFDQAFAPVYNPQAPDRGVNNSFAGFTAQENRGKQLFLQPPPRGGAGCAACHGIPTFALTANSRSNGLDAGETRLFKAPSL